MGTEYSLFGITPEMTLDSVTTIVTGYSDYGWKYSSDPGEEILVYKSTIYTNIYLFVYPDLTGEYVDTITFLVN